jgi:DNA-binding NtrC family response regulator
MSDENQQQFSILIIDDEKSLRNTIKIILEKAGYFVEVAQDFLSVQQQMNEHQFDLMLIDILLPKISGLDLLKKIQEKLQYLGEIIVITGEPNLETAVKAIKLGARDYLEKPILREKLLESIKNVLARKKMTPKLGSIKQAVQSASPEENQLGDRQISPELSSNMSKCLEEVRKALIELKKKYGTQINEEERKLLNIISANITKLDKFLK